MKTIAQLTAAALTEMQTQQTQAKPVNIEAWARWARYETLGDGDLRSMLEATARFTLELKEYTTPRWLSLLGTSGAGKTHLAKRVWEWWESIGKFYLHPCGAQLVRSGQFCRWPKFVNEMQERDFSREVDLCEDEFVILDDIGAEQDRSGFSKGKLSRILDMRLGKWTVLTSNLSLEQIAEVYDARISSRMLRGGSVVVDVNCPDFNLRRRE